MVQGDFRRIVGSKPVGFFVVSFALVLKPSTMPLKNRKLESRVDELIIAPAQANMPVR